jgi:hypothetical protein
MRTNWRQQETRCPQSRPGSWHCERWRKAAIFPVMTGRLRTRNGRSVLENPLPVNSEPLEDNHAHQKTCLSISICSRVCSLLASIQVFRRHSIVKWSRPKSPKVSFCLSESTVLSLLLWAWPAIQTTRRTMYSKLKDVIVKHAMRVKLKKLVAL